MGLPSPRLAVSGLDPHFGSCAGYLCGCWGDYGGVLLLVHSNMSKMYMLGPGPRAQAEFGARATDLRTTPQHSETLPLLRTRSRTGRSLKAFAQRVFVRRRRGVLRRVPIAPDQQEDFVRFAREKVGQAPIAGGF